MNHRDRVKIVKGFYRGVNGTVIGTRGWIFKEYEITFSWYDKHSISWDTRSWIPKRHLKNISNNLTKGNVIFMGKVKGKQ